MREQGVSICYLRKCCQGFISCHGEKCSNNDIPWQKLSFEKGKLIHTWPSFLDLDKISLEEQQKKKFITQVQELEAEKGFYF